MLLTLYGQAISFSCRRNNPNNRGPTHLYTNDFYTPTNVFKPSQKPLRQWVLTWVLIRSLILKVTSEGKSGCGLTLYSSGTSRSKITIGKKQHLPPSVYSCRAPVPDGRKAYTLFPCVRGLSSLPFGKGPGFSRWCVQSSHLAVCIPSAPSTPVATAVGTRSWNGSGLCRIVIRVQCSPREVCSNHVPDGVKKAGTNISLSLSSLDAFLPSMCMCSLFWLLFKKKKKSRFFHVFYGSIFRPIVVLSQRDLLVWCQDPAVATGLWYCSRGEGGWQSVWSCLPWPSVPREWSWQPAATPAGELMPTEAVDEKATLPFLVWLGQGIPWPSEQKGEVASSVNAWG